jgi:hypothetical protein
LPASFLVLDRYRICNPLVGPRHNEAKSHGQLRIIARMLVGRIISLAEYASEYVRLGPLPAGPVDHDFPRLHPSLAIARHLAALIKLPIASMGTHLNFERSIAPQELPTAQIRSHARSGKGTHRSARRALVE